MKRYVPSECGSCGSEERWLLHNVRHRGIYHRLCTSCVLKLHAGLYCPNCFEVYEGSSLPVHRVMCLRCPSVSHLSCVSKDVASCYVCPSCLNPNFVFFDHGASNKSRDSDGELVPTVNEGVIDVKLAKVLVAAAQIASISMGKAVAIARMEAERRGKEAALARKRAREALERFSSLTSKEKLKGKETEVVGRVSNYASAVEPKTKSEGNNGSAASVAAHKRFQSQSWVDTVDRSSGVAVSLNNNLLREKESVVGFPAPNIAKGPFKNGVRIEDMDRLKGSPPLVTESRQLQKDATVNGNENSSNLPHVQKNGIHGESSVTPGATTLQHSQNNRGIETGRGSSKGPGGSGMSPHIAQSSQDAFGAKTNEGVLPMGSPSTAS